MMINLLKQFKSSSFLAIAFVFLFAATLSSCGETKKEESDQETTTEMDADGAMQEMPMDSAMHDEHHHSDSAGEEHPHNGGEEHPSN